MASGGIAPSKSTAHISMLPYAYTNNDVAHLCDPFGKIAKVTILRDKTTWTSKGVAFVQFVRVESAMQAVQVLHGRVVEGLTLKCEMARDNGRTKEFIKKKVYKKVDVCYECKEPGHVSYNCPRNVLGARTKPPKDVKTLKRKHKVDDRRDMKFSRSSSSNRTATAAESHDGGGRGGKYEEEEGEDVIDPGAGNGGSTARYTFVTDEGDDEFGLSIAAFSRPSLSSGDAPAVKQRRSRRKTGYFSDEDISDD